jgi:sugar lactone lactonase YvrE
MMPSKQKEIELVVDAKAKLGEGSIWDAKKQLLYWVEIEGGFVHIYDPATGKDKEIRVGQKVGTVVVRRSGGLMLAVQDGFASFDPASGKLEVLAPNPESKTTGNRFNDGKCDPAGRFWAGTLGRGGSGALYCLQADGRCEKKEGNITTSNGIVWSLDKKTMYYIDTHALNVAAYDYDLASGTIANKREVIRVDGDQLGHPDGMTQDAEGMLWIAHWDGAAVRRWDPKTGKLLESVSIPAQKVTSCAFGGRNLDELYVTTANYDHSPQADPEFPQAGGLFRFKPGVKGLEAFEFAG